MISCCRVVPLDHVRCFSLLRQGAGWACLGPGSGTRSATQKESHNHHNHFIVVQNHQIQPIDSICLDRGPNSINICLSVYPNLVLVLVFVDAADSHLFLVVIVFGVVVC